MKAYSVQVTNLAGTYEVHATDELRDAVRSYIRFNCGGGRKLRIVHSETGRTLSPRALELLSTLRRADLFAGLVKTYERRGTLWVEAMKKIFILRDSTTGEVMVVRVLSGGTHAARKIAAEARPAVPWCDVERVEAHRLNPDGPLGVVFHYQ